MEQSEVVRCGADWRRVEWSRAECNDLQKVEKLSKLTPQRGGNNLP